MCPNSAKQEFSEVDLRQRHPFLAFYLLAAAFSVALVVTNRVHSPWHQAIRVLTFVIAAFAVWSFFRLLNLTDERQRRTNYQALRFGFTATLLVSLLGGFVQGFGVSLVSWGGILALQLIAWSVGLILFSWRYR
jgi:uncharacterized membrane-anchored protein YitT (DUF2179 family)